jgi:transposase-like protein
MHRYCEGGSQRSRRKAVERCATTPNEATERKGRRHVISDSHEGLKMAARKVLGATWQRCSVHFMRNALAYVNVKQRGMVAAAIRDFM